ncbi:MAG: hypothetical protein M5U14_15830 [Acidimicrobiia bacterium]|nr:hypothetical protein [Acidimicrobiia bacterium]
MPTNPVTGAGATSGSPLAPQLQRDDQFGKDTFLKLLVAQLRYQNPLQPTDPGEFLSTSAQFTMIEKLTEIAEQSASRTATERVVMASALVGKRVTFELDGETDQGVVTSRPDRTRPGAGPAHRHPGGPAVGGQGGGRAAGLIRPPPPPTAPPTRPEGARPCCARCSPGSPGSGVTRR